MKPSQNSKRDHRKSKKRLKANEEIVKKKIGYLYPKRKSNRTTSKIYFLLKKNNQDQFDCVKLFDINPEISTVKFSEKITDSIKTIKPNKAPCLHGPTLEVWKLENTRKGFASKPSMVCVPMNGVYLVSFLCPRKETQLIVPIPGYKF